jgi:D-glycero-D-manno-heptose 1,7-bisphosphate phosphatase
MLHQAAQELGLDLAESFMVGDKLSDMATGHQAGCRTVLLLSDLSGLDSLSSLGPDETPDKVAPDLPTAARWIVLQCKNVV